MGDEALDMLTDEERAGLEEPEVDEEALKDIAREEEGDPDEEVDPPAAEPKDEPVAKEPPVEEEPAAEVVDDVPAMEPPKAPETFDFDAKEDAYAKALTEGDTETAKAIRAEIRSAEKVQAKYEAEVAAFNMIQERELAVAKANWNRDVNYFLKGHTEYRDNAVLFDALDTTIKRLSRTDAEFASMSGPVALEYAHKQVQAAFGRTPEPKKEDAPSKEKPKSERPKVPTLGALPNAAPEDTGRDEFEHIDALREKDPEAYEEALSKLSPVQQQKYLRG